MTSDRRYRRMAVLLCLLPAAYFALIALYALLNYAEFASDLPRLMRYVIGPLLIAAALIAGALLPNPENALMIGITAMSIMIGLFIFEGYMRWRTLPERVGLAGVVGENVDLERYGTAMPPAYTLKAMNIQLGTERLADAFLAATPDAEMLLCSQMGQPVTTHTDSLGFRNPTTPQAPIDIMVLGDSFGEGICLADGEGFVDRMRESDASILNTSSRGAGPLYELAVLGRYGPQFRPRITVFAFFEGNDWENLEREDDLPWLIEALDPNADFGPVAISLAQQDRAQERIAEWWHGSAATVGGFLSGRSVIRNFLALQQTASILGLHYPKAAEPNPVFARILDRAVALTGEWGGRVVVVYIPSLDRFGGVFPHDFVNDPLRNMVAEAASDAQIGFIDLTPAFRANGDPRAFYAPDAHLNADGAALAAETIMTDPAMNQP